MIQIVKIIENIEISKSEIKQHREISTKMSEQLTIAYVKYSLIKRKFKIVIINKIQMSKSTLKHLTIFIMQLIIKACINRNHPRIHITIYIYIAHLLLF